MSTEMIYQSQITADNWKQNSINWGVRLYDALHSFKHIYMQLKILSYTRVHIDTNGHQHIEFFVHVHTNVHTID